jgi:hypothetical protein
MPRVSEKKQVLTAIEAELDSRQALLESIQAVRRVMLLDNEDNNDDDNDSTFDTIIECNELVVETLQYTYDEIKSKRYLMERKPY